MAVLGLALLALGVAAAAAVRQHDLDEASRIRLRYGRRIIEVAALEVPAGYGVVDVRDVADLISPTDRTDGPVLHHRSAATDTYLVEGDAAIYRYRIERAPTDASGQDLPAAGSDSGRTWDIHHGDVGADLGDGHESDPRTPQDRGRHVGRAPGQSVRRPVLLGRVLSVPGGSSQ